MPDKSKLPRHFLQELSWDKSYYVFDSVGGGGGGVCVVYACVYSHMCVQIHMHIHVLWACEGPKLSSLIVLHFLLPKQGILLNPGHTHSVSKGSHPALEIIFLCLLSPGITDSHYICPAFTQVISVGSMVPHIYMAST